MSGNSGAGKSPGETGITCLPCAERQHCNCPSVIGCVGFAGAFYEEREEIDGGFR